MMRMRYVFGKQDMRSLDRAQESCVLMTNGLGGFSAMTAAYSVNRCDQGILVGAVSAPNVRITFVHRISEKLVMGGQSHFLSAQQFAGKTPAEEGFRYLESFSYDRIPVWNYEIGGVRVERKLVSAWGSNAAVVLYEIENRSQEDCTLELVPYLKFAPKEQALEAKKRFSVRNGKITDGNYTMYVSTDGDLERTSSQWQRLAYPEDAKDGRPAKGLSGSCFRITKMVPAGEKRKLEVVFSLDKKLRQAQKIVEGRMAHDQALDDSCVFTDPVAKVLNRAADDYIVRRDSTDGKTIIAGYPLFSDWGRDTMIALGGCCLSTGRFEDAKSILRTFLAYEKDGLVPNLFPEGENDPMYNTVDAALLLIDAVWQYVQRTGDWNFVREAWPKLQNIVACYRAGTHHSIGMDSDGLIYAGGGLDQVTWMDVCVNGILPTPRHGKPVEINAYWYNALRIMDAFAKELGEDPKDYAVLAELVRSSFVEKFYMEEKGYLRDVLSGTHCDEQLRCNQIWAVSMPFGMLSPEQERNVVQTVQRHLHTPCGLRTLSPEDAEYHPHYGGAQVERDMAYHQGTTWVFPMGAYYLAYLKVNGNSAEAAQKVRKQLDALEPMLREGCLGQLPEIYDGDFPTEGKGCFAQAWSVGEMLRVFEALEDILKK